MHNSVTLAARVSLEDGTTVDTPPLPPHHFTTFKYIIRHYYYYSVILEDRFPVPATVSRLITRARKR